MRIRHLVRITGIVQGVGFRPFVYRLALEHGLDGFVLNDGEGVFVEIEGEAAALRSFEDDLVGRAPSAARIDQVRSTAAPPLGYSGFEIRASRTSPERTARVSPELATCAACLEEIRDPADRRHRYPFTNCTHCGPRFTIIRDVPYDRDRTTMAGFRMCAACRSEYHDPTNRRFHAQPNACSECGPQAALLNAEGVRMPAVDPLEETRRLLLQGAIVAVKGLGGYHLACDATNELAVQTLRNRKVREEKPFALMAPDLEAIGQWVVVNEEDRQLLLSPSAPIVLLRRKPGCRLPASIAPGQEHLGFFLPYTPLHHLLFHPLEATGATPSRAPGATGLVPGNPGKGRVWVMTSGNRSDEPIAFRDEEALERLSDIADYFLIHDRPIHLRCDDSVARTFRGTPQILRRARGFVPRSIHLPWPVPAHTLATGPMLKNTYALAKGFDCYLGPHVGDLENLETYRAFEEGIRHLEKLFDIRPAVVAYDLHPDYLSSRFAVSLEAEFKVPCQHHEAHVASVLGEHGVEEPAIGIALDGTGFGHDGTIWGGEFFVVRDRRFTRAAHLTPIPLPGGDRAVREPWRSALAHLRHALPASPWSRLSALLPHAPRESITLVQRMLERNLNCPHSSGAGRLFDAAAALILSRVLAAYEGQAPMELEQCALTADPEGHANGLPFHLERARDPWQIDPAPAFAELHGILARGAARAPDLAYRFHRGFADVLVATAAGLAERESIHHVCLSGGVFQNHLLLGLVEHGLEDRGLLPLRNREVPPNDGGISFGQVVLASWRAFHGGGPKASRGASGRVAAARGGTDQRPAGPS